jgi:hypothetical protein
MAYYYHPNHDVYAYECADYGNHGNGDYEYEYNSYSDHNEPDQNPPEPDYHSNETDAPWDEGPEYQTGEEAYEEIGGTHEHGGLEYESGNEAYEHGALEYEPEELEGNEHGVYERDHLVYDDDETRELEELERMVNEEGYEPQGLEYGLERELEHENGEIYQLGELEHEHQEPYELEYELGRNDTDAHYGRYEPQTLESSGVPQRAEPKPKGPGRRTHAHHYPTPTPRNIPGTAHSVPTHSRSRYHLPRVPAPSRTHPTSPPRTTLVTNIPTPTRTHEMREPLALERMFEKWRREPLEPDYGTYKPGYNGYKPNRLQYDRMKVDNEASPPPDFGGGYEEFGMDTESPQPWDFNNILSKPFHPWNEREVILEAREGGSGAADFVLQNWMVTGSQYNNGTWDLWRQHEMENKERKRKRTEPQPPPTPINIPAPPTITTPQTTSPAPSSPPSIRETANGHQLTTYPYGITRSRPPPWPIKEPERNRNQNQHNNNEYPSARPTTRLRPPPWPILPAPSPILIIHPSRPPPWPIIPPHTIQMLRNHQNAKSRLKMKSRLLQRKFLLFLIHICIPLINIYLIIQILVNYYTHYITTPPLSSSYPPLSFIPSDSCLVV